MGTFISTSIATGSMDEPNATVTPTPPAEGTLEDGFGNIFEMTAGGDTWITI